MRTRLTRTTTIPVTTVEAVFSLENGDIIKSTMLRYRGEDDEVLKDLLHRQGATEVYSLKDIGTAPITFEYTDRGLAENSLNVKEDD